jgi:hypothetical protein
MSILRDEATGMIWDEPFVRVQRRNDGCVESVSVTQN